MGTLFSKPTTQQSQTTTRESTRKPSICLTGLQSRTLCIALNRMPFAPSFKESVGFDLHHLKKQQSTVLLYDLKFDSNAFRQNLLYAGILQNSPVVIFVFHDTSSLTSAAHTIKTHHSIFSDKKLVLLRYPNTTPIPPDTLEQEINYMQNTPQYYYHSLNPLHIDQFRDELHALFSANECTRHTVSWLRDSLNNELDERQKADAELELKPMP